MQLILTIENGPQPEMSGRTWRCGTEGGTLGRNPKCDLVLPDPKRYTSSIHALIEFDSDGFTLTDRSTNGTYHNSPKTLIGKNRSVSLDQGDLIFIGDFVLRVEVDAVDADAASARPEPETGSQFDRDQLAPDDDELDELDEPGARTGPFSQAWDNSDFSVPWDGEGTEPGAGDDTGSGGRDEDDEPSFSQSPEREYFAAPSASAGSGDVIPDDWDDFLTGFHDVSKMGTPDSAPRSDPGGEDDRPGSDRTDARDSGSESRDSERQGAEGHRAGQAGPNPFADSEPDPHERFDPPPPPSSTPAPDSDSDFDSDPDSQTRPPADLDDRDSNQDEPGPGGTDPAPARPARPQPTGSQDRAESPENPDPKAASESRGASEAGAADRSRAAYSASDQTTHEILRVVTEGLMGLLQGRAEIKNEFRIAQTRFVQTENNPLKFSPDADEALKRILGSGESPGFLTGKRAFEDAFDDIQAHQLAILSAVQRAIGSAVAQFDPAQIEKKLERISPMSARMPGVKAAKCWSLFSLHYEEMAEKMRDDARQLFLTEFAEAYEEACRAVAQGRRENQS